MPYYPRRPLRASHFDEIDGELCLRLDKAKGTTYLSMFDMFHAWQEQAEKLKSSEIAQEEYDQWRYNFLSKKRKIKADEKRPYQIDFTQFSKSVL